MKIVTICGSMKYATEMMNIACDLEKKRGWCVIQCVYGIDKTTITQNELDNVVNAHWKKIDISDAIYVVNIGGYIGNATKNEIEYTRERIETFLKKKREFELLLEEATGNSGEIENMIEVIG